MEKILKMSKTLRNHLQGHSPICLHFEIHGNEGYLINQTILQKNFQQLYVTLHDPKASSKIIGWDEVFNYINKQPLGVRGLSSTQIRHPISKNNNFNFQSIIFISHPLDRILSLFEESKRMTGLSSAVEKAKKTSLKDFIQQRISAKKNLTLKNWQVRVLSSKDSKAELDDEDLKNSINYLREFTIIGVVDRFEQSMMLAEDVLSKNLGKIFDRFEQSIKLTQDVLSRNLGKIDCTYVRDYNSTKNKDELNEKIKKMMDEVGNDLMQELKKENELDLQLYLNANKILDSRIKKINNFTNKFLDFQERCKKLEDDLIVDKKAEKLLSQAPKWYTVDRILGNSIPQSIQFMIDCLPTIRELIKSWPKSKILQVLDVGGNTGAGSNLLATLHQGHFFRVKMKVDVLDISTHCKPLAEEFFPNINYFSADIFKLDKNRTWDLTICSHVIEHLENPFPFISEVQNHARHWSLFYTPYDERQLNKAHRFRYTKEIVEGLKPKIMKIIKSPGWTSPLEDKKCVIFVLPGKAKNS